MAHDPGSVPDADGCRFVGNLVGWEDREESQAVYGGDGSGQVRATILVTTTSGWRGNVPSDRKDDRGWVLGVYVPFESLGLCGPPPQGTAWGMAVVLHDRDDAVGTRIGDKTWPGVMSSEQPGMWGDRAFGLSTCAPPPASARGTVTIRRGMEGATVADAAVGGTIDYLCPGDPDVNCNQWGDEQFAGAPDFNHQGQADVPDWPCFTKYYISFPLDALALGKIIISTTLWLCEWGGSDPGQAEPSPYPIQVFTVADDWSEATLTRNNAPLGRENVAAAWVDPFPSYPGRPGVPWMWL